MVCEFIVGRVQLCKNELVQRLPQDHPLYEQISSMPIYFTEVHTILHLIQLKSPNLKHISHTFPLKISNPKTIVRPLSTDNPNKQIQSNRLKIYVNAS